MPVLCCVVSVLVLPQVELHEFFRARSQQLLAARGVVHARQASSGDTGNALRPFASCKLGSFTNAVVSFASCAFCCRIVAASTLGAIVSPRGDNQFCPQCGKQFISAFCTGCGHARDEGSASPPPVDIRSRVGGAGTPAKKKTLKKKKSAKAIGDE